MDAPIVRHLNFNKKIVDYSLREYGALHLNSLQLSHAPAAESNKMLPNYNSRREYPKPSFGN